MKKQNHKKLIFFLLAFTFSNDLFADKTTKIEIQGHRGCRALRPENSLVAFEHAMDLGVDTLEMDLAVSKDGHLVVSHDPRINSLICLDHEGKPIEPGQAPYIHDLTLDQIKQFDCGTKSYPRFKNQIHSPTKIPTLDEVFEMVIEKEKSSKKAPVMFNIETKSFRDIEKDDHPLAPSAFARLWYENVKKYGMLKRSTLQSFDYRTLIAAKALDKSITIAALSEDPGEDLVKTAKILRAEIISPQWDMPNVNKGTIEKIHRMNTKIIPWTANDSKAWDKLLELKVDGIISDDPQELIKYLKTSK